MTSRRHLLNSRGAPRIVARLEHVFEMHGEEAKKQKCKGMEGVLDEGSEMLGKDAAPPVRDAAIISGCQRVEHYEIAAYGSVRTCAEQLGHRRAATTWRLPAQPDRLRFDLREPGTPQEV